MPQIFDPNDPQPMVPPKSDLDLKNAVVVSYPTLKYSPPHRIYAMAYGGFSNRSTSRDIEVRVQKLEKQQKVVRRGIVLATAPQFKGNSVISQTSANNPFVQHPNSTISFPSGQVPDRVAPSTNNSDIKFPNTPNET